MTGNEFDHPPVVDQAIGLDGAGVFNHPALNGVCRLRRQDDQSPRRHHGIAIFYISGNRRWRNQHIGQGMVGLKLQLEGLTGCQHNGAPSRHHHPFVSHLWCQKRNIAPKLGGDAALVENLASGSCATKGVVA